MASDYGLNFGFRRSDESIRMTEGRQKTPVDVSAAGWFQGAGVMLDSANPGFLKKAPAAESPVAGYHGLLIQEEAHIGSVYGPDVAAHDSFSLSAVKGNKLSVMTSGAGVKIWLQNTTGSTRADGRVIPTNTIFTAAGVAVGDYLAWDGSKFVETATVAEAWMRVLLVATGYVEAVLTF